MNIEEGVQHWVKMEIRSDMWGMKIYFDSFEQRINQMLEKV